MSKYSDEFNKFYESSRDDRFTFETVIPFYVAYYIEHYKKKPHYSEADIMAIVMNGSKGQLNPATVETIVEREWNRKFKPGLVQK